MGVSCVSRNLKEYWGSSCRERINVSITMIPEYVPATVNVTLTCSEH